MSINIQPMGQGPAKIADSNDLIRDAEGYTNPNLHRRINTSNEDDISVHVGIYGVNSYRTVEYEVHDEESTTSEIP